MKRINFLLALFLFTAIFSCNKKLVEEPRSTLVPDALNTVQGVQMALDAAYAGTRLLWGNQDFFTITVIGTDEFQRGVDGNNDINVYNSNYTPAHGTVNANWRNAYTFINTANAVIDNTPKVNLAQAAKDRMIGEAKFLRANYYFALVQFFGDVTLNKNFQPEATTSATRVPIAEVYSFIVQDLKDAIPALPAGPKSNGMLPGKASAAAAKHLLAKVYLARAGSSAKQATDYQDAYNIAMDVINNRGALQLSLLPDFGKVFAEGNEENSEVIWTVQHTSNIAFNGPNNSGVSNFSADNVLNHMWVPQYENQPGMMRSTQYGRPYIRCTPTRWLTDTVWGNKTNDTRYGKTFQTVWYANLLDTAAKKYPKWPATLPPGAPAGAVPLAPKFKLGDTAIYMPGSDRTNAQIAAAPY